MEPITTFDLIQLQLHLGISSSSGSFFQNEILIWESEISGIITALVVLYPNRRR